MELRGKKILECPVHLQKRLDNDPIQVGDDMLSERLTKKKRCQAEIEDRALAQKVSSIVNVKTDTRVECKPEARSASSDDSGPHN